ncbi:hypothetical protein K0A97_02960 [Patescibacteria group bacterium]|nr:hypothetical protein [Patescibacteria group bacterium]
MEVLRIKRSIFFLGVLILFFPLSEAIIGVRPAIYEINFEPNLTGVFPFTFIGDPGVEFEIYSEGAFSEYVTLNTNRLKGGGQVNALLQLPLESNEPGRRMLLIGAKQIPKDVAMLGMVGNVRGVIFINVPYPGKYAELEFRSSNANVGESIEFNFKIYSRGKEDINTFTKIDIYDLTGNFIESIFLETGLIKSGEFFEGKAFLNTENYVAGDYLAVLSVDYGEGVTEKETIFKLGRLFVGISNYTKTFERGKLNRFEIEVESFWNNPIENVYANVSIINYSRLNFLSPSITLSPWGKKILTGFFDTTDLNEEQFQALIQVYYEGGITNKTVDLMLKEEESKPLYLIGGGIIILLLGGFLIWLFIIKKRKEKRWKKQEKQEKSKKTKKSKKKGK